MSSLNYARYSSVAAQAERDRREAGVAWQAACASRDALLARRDTEAHSRAGLRFEVPRAARNIDGLSLDDIRARTGDLIAQTAALSHGLDEALHGWAQKKAERYLSATALPKPVMRVRSDAAEPTPATVPSTEPADVADWRGDLDHELGDLLADATRRGLDPDVFDEIVGVIRGQAAESDARYTVGSLVSAIDEADRERERVAALLEEQSVELSNIAARFALHAEDAEQEKLPDRELADALAQAGRGEIVPEPLLQRLTAAAALADEIAAHRIRILDRDTTMAVLIEEFRARGSRVVTLGPAVVVENGVLVTRDEWPNHVLELAESDGQITIREMRVWVGDDPSADYQEDRAVEQGVCELVAEVAEVLPSRGASLAIEDHKVKVPVLGSGKSRPKESAISFGGTQDVKHSQASA